MKLEKRNGAAPSEVPEEPQERGKKPVVVYIMVLFIAAFLLMAWSFASHQRSNTEALGQLQNSFNAMQEVQATQDRMIALQKELAESKEIAESLQTALDGATDTASHTEYRLERTQEAMEWFWQLDEKYVLEDLDACRTILAEMNQNPEDPLSEYLTPLAAERYQEISEELEAQAD